MGEEKSELEKWSDVHDDWVAIENFFEGLSSQGDIALCQYYGHNWFPMTAEQRRKLFEKINNIDATKLEQERRALYDGFGRQV